jgi:hypothetical protein
MDYFDMVRFIRSAFLMAALAIQGLSCAAAQPRASTPAPKDQMFSGTVTAVSADSITATRTGSKDSKTFVITPETRFEGPKPQVNSRVTIRYVSGEDGERAVRVIVRATAAKK